MIHRADQSVNGLRWPPDSSAQYVRYGLGIGVNLACGEEIIGATGGAWGAVANFSPAGGATIAGTVNIGRADRSTLLDDEVVCALRCAIR